MVTVSGDILEAVAIVQPVGIADQAGQAIEVNIHEGGDSDGGPVCQLPEPPDMANREETRWCALTDGSAGAVSIATGDMAVSALPYTGLDMALAGYIYQLPPAGDPSSTSMPRCRAWVVPPQQQIPNNRNTAATCEWRFPASSGRRVCMGNGSLRIPC